MGAIYLIRHGQASFASSDYDNLSALGGEQARMLGEALRARKFEPDLVMCGGMLRHRQTAEHCLRALFGGTQREAAWEEDRGWDEYDHQRMLEAFDPRYARKTELAVELLERGDPKRTFQELFSQAAARWVGGQADHDYDESFGAFCARVEAALARLHARKVRTALVFTSGGAISAVCRQLLGLADDRVMDLSYTLANASITKVIYGRSGLRLSTLNEHGHFEGRDPKFLTYR